MELNIELEKRVVRLEKQVSTLELQIFSIKTLLSDNQIAASYDNDHYDDEATLTQSKEAIEEYERLQEELKKQNEEIERVQQGFSNLFHPIEGK